MLAVSLQVGLGSSQSNSQPTAPSWTSTPRNILQRSLRCLGERGFALLTGRSDVQHVTDSPNKISKIAQAALVLTHFEHGYLPC